MANYIDGAKKSFKILHDLLTLRGVVSLVQLFYFFKASTSEERKEFMEWIVDITSEEIIADAVPNKKGGKVK